MQWNQPGQTAFYFTNSQMQIIDITQIVYSWAAAGPLTQINFEPEVLVTYSSPVDPPVVASRSEFNQRAPLGYGVRGLVFFFNASQPTAAHTLTIELDGVCSIVLQG